MDAFVLRGGTFKGVSHLANMRRVFEAYGEYGICVTASEAESPAALAKEARYGGDTLLVGTAAEIATDGRRVVREPDHEWPDALILFPEEPTGQEWDDLREIMTRMPPEPNPNAKK